MIFITRGAGFIGANFVLRWLEQHAEPVLVIDKLTYAGNLETLADVAENPRYRFVQGDIGDPGVAGEVMEGADAVVNFAAETHVDRSIMSADEFLRTDILGVHNLLETARPLAQKRLIDDAQQRPRCQRQHRRRRDRQRFRGPPGGHQHGERGRTPGRRGEAGRLGQQEHQCKEAEPEPNGDRGAEGRLQDGTANEAANGLAGSATALGVAPAGTMNLLARVLGLPIDAAAAAERTVASGTTRPVVPGDAEGRLFVLMAGAGFDAWVLRELLSRVRGKIRFRDYARGALRGLRTFPFATLRLEADGVAIPAHSVIVGRAPLYGGFLRPTPAAELGTARFQACALDGGATALARALAAMWTGSHGGLPGTSLRSARRVTIAAARGDLPYQLDGELAGALPIQLTLSDRRLLLAG